MKKRLNNWEITTFDTFYIKKNSHLQRLPQTMDPPQLDRSPSAQMRAHIPEQRARRKLQRLAQIKNHPQHCSKVPVWLDVTYRKEEKPFVMDPDKKFTEFREAIKAYLMYYKENSDKGYYYVLKNQNTKFTLTNGHVEMGELYDKYKTKQGWLEIQIKQDSIF